MISGIIGLVVGVIQGVIGLVFGLVSLAFGIVGGVIGLIFGLIALVLQFAVVVAVVAGGVWVYRRLRGDTHSRYELREGNADWQYIRGKIDRDTYLRRQALNK